MSESVPEISVVFPTRNEEPAIGDAIRTLREVFSDRILEIVVSDNSTDRTPDIARDLGARVVTPPKLGYGQAYIFGLKHCGAGTIAMADPDGTYDLRELPLLIGPIDDGRADLVIGSRLKGHMEKGAMPAFKRYIGNPFLTWLLNILFHVGISDAHCGMRAFTRRALERMDLRTPGMEFASEMLVEAKRKRLRIEEVPISYRRRMGSASKLNWLRDGWRHVSYMLGARLGR